MLRQRNALLRQAAGRLDERRSRSTCGTPLASSGAALAAARLDLLDRMPVLASTYDALARRPAHVAADYEAAWACGRPGDDGGRRPPAGAHGGARGVRAGGVAPRHAPGVSTVGPHRDEVALSIGGAPARTQASQSSGRWRWRCGWPPTTW